MLRVGGGPSPSRRSRADWRGPRLRSSSAFWAYFALPVEPPLATALLAAVAVCLIWWLARKDRVHPLGRLLAFAFAGLVWGQLYVALNPITILPASTGKVEVSGWVHEAGATSAARSRVILDVDRIAALRAEHMPRLIQLTALSRELPPLVQGQYICFEAWLYPQLTPVQPGGWGHARITWFEGVGGNGRIAGPIVVDEALSRPAGWWGWVDGLRMSIAHRIRASLLARESGRAGDATAKCAAPRSGASLSCGWIARRFPHATAGPPIS
jgi:hypothetical protein